jgi:hypothetical protein
MMQGFLVGYYMEPEQEVAQVFIWCSNNTLGLYSVDTQILARTPAILTGFFYFSSYHPDEFQNITSDTP